MKRVVKTLLWIFGILYSILAIFLTACLLGYNEYKITEFGDISLITVENNELKPRYLEGDLLVVDGSSLNNIEIGDDIIFYNTYNNQVNIAISQVIEKEEITEDEITFTVSGDYDISSEYVIGSTETTKVYKTIGTILSMLESRIGFLLIIIFPIAILFLYEVYIIIGEIRSKGKED